MWKISENGFLDSILDIEGLTGITGGPNDLAASLGHPGEPNHKERIRVSEDTEKRTRRAGKLVASDIFSTVDICTYILNI